MFSKINRQTITERIKKNKEEVAILNPGPKPIINNEIKAYLKQWIIGMQINGVPVQRDMILVKGNDIYHSMYGTTR